MSSEMVAINTEPKKRGRKPADPNAKVDYAKVISDLCYRVAEAIEKGKLGDTYVDTVKNLVTEKLGKITIAKRQGDLQSLIAKKLAEGKSFDEVISTIESL